MDNNSFSYATIDAKSNILDQTQNFKKLFNCDTNLYSSPELNKYKKILLTHDKNIFDYGVINKTLLVNIFEENIVINKYPIIVYGQIVGIQLIPEIFRINKMNNLFYDGITHLSEIPEKYKNITGYSDFQQEIIFCLLVGIRTCKSIVNFIQLKTNILVEVKSVSNALEAIYSKLLVNNKESLIFVCCCLNFDKYLPKKLFPAGVYLMQDLFQNIKNNHK